MGRQHSIKFDSPYSLRKKNMSSVIKFRQGYVDFIALMSMVKKRQ